MVLLTLPKILVKHLGLTNGFGRLPQQSWSSTLASPMVSADFLNSFNQALGLLSGSNSSIEAINLSREWSLSAVHPPVDGHRNVERRVRVLAELRMLRSSQNNFRRGVRSGAEVCDFECPSVLSTIPVEIAHHYQAE